jgi:acetate kinase
MLILVINSGSSSIKFKIFRRTGANFRLKVKGMAEAIGLKNSQLGIESDRDSKMLQLPLKNHLAALEAIFSHLKKFHFLDVNNHIDLIGHRIVHGGEKYIKPVKVTPKILNDIKKLSQLAPLHNPAHIACMEACVKIFPQIPQVAAFDTSFHSTMPPTAYLYAIPTDLYKKYGLRRYGFHGINNEYVTREATRLLKQRRQKHQKLICIHLGNGCSMTAIKNGKCLENSMGFTPLEGLMMGTRAGDIDPALLEVLSQKLKLDLHETTEFLNKQSGLLGMSGLSSDMRTIHAAVLKKNSRAIQALDSYCYRIGKYLNAYIGILGGVDAIIMTGGVGENAWYAREKIFSYVGHLNIKLDKTKNRKNLTFLENKNSAARIMIIPANEELEIAQQAVKLL